MPYGRTSTRVTTVRFKFTPISTPLYDPVRNTYVHSWTPVYREAMGLKVPIAKMFSLLTHMPNFYIVKGVTVFGCFPRFLALLQVLYFFVCGVD